MLTFLPERLGAHDIIFEHCFEYFNFTFLKFIALILLTELFVSFAGLRLWGLRLQRAQCAPSEALSPNLGVNELMLRMWYSCVCDLGSFLCYHSRPAGAFTEEIFLGSGMLSLVIFLQWLSTFKFHLSE